MSNETCFLVVILYKHSQGQELIRAAIKLNNDSVHADVIEYPMEPSSRKVIHGLLPQHVASCGEIVEVQRIFSISVAS